MTSVIFTIYKIFNYFSLVYPKFSYYSRFSCPRNCIINGPLMVLKPKRKSWRLKSPFPSGVAIPFFKRKRNATRALHCYTTLLRNQISQTIELQPHFSNHHLNQPKYSLFFKIKRKIAKLISVNFKSSSTSISKKKKWCKIIFTKKCFEKKKYIYFKKWLNYVRQTHHYKIILIKLLNISKCTNHA